MLKKYQDHITGITKVTFADGHVGGCNIYGDPTTECIKTWKYLESELNVKSAIDIGCGFGYHAKGMEELGWKVLGVEGSAKVTELAVTDCVIHHDYTTGPFVPSEVYDLAWCIEFVEHVEGRFKNNFFETFKWCKYLALTHGTPGQGGYHHVNEQHKQYWIEHLSRVGFNLMQNMTDACRAKAEEDFADFQEWISGDMATYRGPSAEAWKTNNVKPKSLQPWFCKNGLVFLNTALASE